MAFVIQIKGDANQLDTTLTRVGAELDKLEGKGKRAGEAVSRGMREGSSSAEKAKIQLAGFAENLERMVGLNKSWASSFGSVLGPLSQVSSLLHDIGGAFNTATGFVAGVARAVDSLTDLNHRLNVAGDGLIEMRNQLRRVTDSQRELDEAMTGTHSAADRAYADWGKTNELYQKLAYSTKGLGVSQTELLGMTESLTKMFTASGKGAAATSSAMLQLGQAMASGRLQGDEFRSVSETMPELLDVFARQLHVTRGELKGLASDGRITTDIIVKGLREMADASDIAMAQMETTFAQRITPMANAMRADPMAAIRAQSGGSDFSDLAAQVDLLRKASQQDLAAEFGVGGINLKNAGYLYGFDLSQAPGQVSELNVQIGKFRDLMHDINAGGPSGPWSATMASDVTSVSDAINKAVDAGKQWDDVLHGSQVQRQIAGLTQTMIGFGAQGVAALDDVGAAFDRMLGKFTTGGSQLSSSIADFARRALGGGPDLGPWGLSDADIAARMGKHNPSRGSFKGRDYSAVGAELSGIGNDMLGLLGASGLYDSWSGKSEPLENMREMTRLQKEADEDRYQYLQLIAKKEYDIRELRREQTQDWLKESAFGIASSKTSAYQESAMRRGDVGYGFSSAVHELTDDATNSAKLINSAFKTAFSDVEAALLDFVQTGKLSLSSLAHDLERLLLQMAFRQAVGSFFGGGIPMPGAGGGGGGFPIPGASPEQLAGSSSARAAPQQIHLHIGDDAAVALLTSPTSQSAITNVVYERHGVARTVRERIRSRG